MTTIQALIKGNPVLTYDILVFAISWGLIQVVIGPGGFLGSEGIPDALSPLLYISVLAGPGIAGGSLTVIIDGKADLGELLCRLFRWRVGAHWYAVALLTAPLLSTAVLSALSTGSSEFLPVIITSADKVGLLLIGIVAGLAVISHRPLGKEKGSL